MYASQQRRLKNQGKLGGLQRGGSQSTTGQNIQRRPQTSGQNQLGALNRTSQEIRPQGYQTQASSNSVNRSFNAPMPMRHISPNQHVSNSFTQGAGSNNYATQPRLLQQPQSRPYNKSRGPQAVQQPQKLPNVNNQNQANKQQRQYQPSLMFKPGQAKQHLQSLKQEKSEPEIVNSNSYQTQQPMYHPQHPDMPPRQGTRQLQAQYQSQTSAAGNNFQPQFASNQSYGRPIAHNETKILNQATRSAQNSQTRPKKVEGPTQSSSSQKGAQNQNPYPMQYNSNTVIPTQYGASRPSQYASQTTQGTNQRQPFTSPDPSRAHHNLAPPASSSTEGLKRSPKRGPQNLVGTQKVVSPKRGTPKRSPKYTHQMRAYESVPTGAGYANKFHPEQRVDGVEDAFDDHMEAEDEDMHRYDLPRSVPEEDLDIEEMQNWLAELGQEVSDLKKRPLYQKRLQGGSGPSSSAKRRGAAQGNVAKSNSLSPQPVSKSRSKSYHSSSQEGTTSNQNLNNSAEHVHHRSLSPKAVGNARISSNPALQRENQHPTSSSQNPSSNTRSAQRSKGAPQVNASQPAKDSSQWASPNNNYNTHHARQRVTSHSSLIATSTQSNQVRATPSHTNTMSLTVSNALTIDNSNAQTQNQHQERLFRLSPLSSKMQEDTDGDEASTSQREGQFNLNQSINTSQLDSSSPENLQGTSQTRQRQRQSANQALSNSQSASIMQELAAMPMQPIDASGTDGVIPPVGSAGNTSRRLVGGAGSGAQTSSVEDQRTESGRGSLIHQRQSYSEMAQVQRSSVLGSSIGRSVDEQRAETPLTASEVFQDKSSKRAFSRSSNRRGRNTDTEGPATRSKSAMCQTDKIKEPSPVRFVPVPKEDTGTQTHRRDFAPIQLSPFDTYDLLFVKDLVNTLNHDNEVLVESNQDLKYSFYYLLQKHKQVQLELSREKSKNFLLDTTQERLKEVTAQRDEALERGLELSNKVETMNRVIRLAVEEQKHLEEEAELLTNQLEEENKMLRSLLKISEEYSAPTTQAHLLSSIEEIEKKQQEIAYKADLRLREQVKEEYESEYERLKLELPQKIEDQLKGKYDEQTKENNEAYEAKIAKLEQESALLKKTLLEQSLQRLHQIDHGSDEGSNSLENSQGLHHFSAGSSSSINNRDTTAAHPSKQFSNPDQATAAALQTSTASDPSSQASNDNNSFHSSQKDLSNNSQSEVIMQHHLDQFTSNLFNDFTKEEQELVNQLTGAQPPKSSSSSAIIAQGGQDQLQTEGIVIEGVQDADTSNGNGHDGDDIRAENDDEEDGGGKMDAAELVGGSAEQRRQGYRRKDSGYPGAEEEDEDEDDEDDDYADDFETFGEEAKSPSQEAEERNLIQVVTNPKPKKNDEGDMVDDYGNYEREKQDWDFDKGFSQNLFDERGQDSPDLKKALEEMDAEKVGEKSPNNDANEMLDEDFLSAESSPMASKMSGAEDGRDNEDEDGDDKDKDEDQYFYDNMYGSMPRDDNNTNTAFDGIIGGDRQNVSAQDFNAQDRAEDLKQKFDEFFTSESDEIEDELIDGESSDSDSDSGQVSSKSFDELYEAQEKAKKKRGAQDMNNNDLLGLQGESSQPVDDPMNPKTSPKLTTASLATASPNPTTASTKAPGLTDENSSSERRNKYKRDKRASGGPPSAGAGPSRAQVSGATPPEESKKAMEPEGKTSSFMDNGNQRTVKGTASIGEGHDDDDIEFNPPQEVIESSLADDFEDFFKSANEMGRVGTSSQSKTTNDDIVFDSDNFNMDKKTNLAASTFDLIDDWDDSDDGDSFNPIGQPSSGFLREGISAGNGQSSVASGNKGSGMYDGMDEEDRRFFEELNEGFAAKEAEIETSAGAKSEMSSVERNEQMDDTRATRLMLKASRAFEGGQDAMKPASENEAVEDLGTIDFEAERVPEKEEEYDYFLDNQADENSGNAQGYHVIDEADLQDSEEDLEEIDDEERELRHREMLKEFKEKMERDDKRSSRSPRHKPRYQHERN